MTLGKFVRTKEHDRHISEAKKLYYSNPENIEKHKAARKNVKWHHNSDFSKECIKSKGVLYYRFVCVDCGALHYSQKIKEKPRNPRCVVCASKRRSIGRVFTQEAKDKISASLMGHKPSAKKGGKLSPEHIEKIRLVNTGNTYRRGKHQPEEARHKLSESNKRRFQSVEEREKLSIRAKKMWQDPNSKVNSDEYKAMRDIVFWNMLKNKKISNYNGKEQYLDKLLQKVCPNQYRYNGSGQLGFKIFRHTPDFVNVDGQKKIIEMSGCAWQ